MSEVVGRQPEWSQCIGAPCIGAWGGHSVADEQQRVTRANLRAFISSLMGGRMAANGDSVPIVGRSADACPYKSEKQAEVAGLTAE